MLIGFDASRAFVREATGTENYSLNLLWALAEVDRKNRYRVYVRKNPNSTRPRPSRDEVGKLQIPNYQWPKNFEFKVIWPSRLWTQIGLALETWKSPVDILFIPAHTLPILRRRKIGIFNFQFSIFNFYAKEAKYIVTIHDLGVEFLPGYHQFPQRYYLDFASKYACRHADAIIAVSAATKADIVKRYQIEAQKVFTVHEGVDTRFFKPQSKVKVVSVKSKYKIKGDYILFVGTVQPRKNLEMLIKAFSLLVHSSQFTVHSKAKSVNREPTTVNLQLVIAGKLGWDYQEILDAPKKYKVGDKVKFLNYVNREDLPALYSGARVFAFPSLFEGFGLPILEALSCGCSVVASDIPPHREIFDIISRNFQFPILQSKTFLSNFQFRTSRKLLEPMILVKPDDINKWTTILHQYISQYNKEPLKIGARNLASKFSWDTTASVTLKIFGRVLG